MSLLDRLECSVCGGLHDAERLQGVSSCCQAPLYARYDLDAARRLVSGTDASRVFGSTPSLWRYADLLPRAGLRGPVTLGEGWTPLLPARRLAEEIGLPGLMLKDETRNPTGTFKARGMSAAVTRARALGATHLLAPTAGNAGGALAAYAAAAGLRATVAMPRDAPTANKAEVRAAGAELIEVDGLISDCAAVLREMAPRSGAFDVSTLKEPFRLEGKKTMGFELWEQTESLPDVIVFPTGGGAGIVGMAKAFDELEVLGLLGSERPRFVAVQSAGCAPIVRAFDSGAERAEAWKAAATIAGGLRVPSPFGDRPLLAALRASGGRAIAVPDAEIRSDMHAVAASTGLLVGPEAAASITGVRHLVADGWVGQDESVVAFLTGTGLKHLEMF